MPNPDGEYLESLSEKVGMESEAFALSIRQAIRQIEDSWKARSATLHQDSVLELRLLDREPGFGMVSCDDVTVVTLNGIMGRQGGEAGFAYIHEGDLGEYPLSWFRGQLTALFALPREYQGTTDA